ncbi:MAG TPA: ABC transporter permease, partial [Bryobacteraceae bacterium]|nr:ABC transporter permease [Bryobacteraceae bacterium]
MSWANRFRNLFRKNQLQADLEEELQFHLQSRAKDNLASGMPPSEAQQDAERRFGNQTLIVENSRDADLVLPLHDFGQDVRFAARLIRRRPIFAALAVLLLALGIGASTAMFGLLLRAVFPHSAFENSNRLVFLWRFDKLEGRFLERLSYLDLSNLRSQSRGFAGLSIYHFLDLNVNVSGEPQTIPAFEIEPSWLTTLAVSPRFGRNISPGDRNVVLLTHDLWTRLFASDPHVLGRTLTIANQPFTVIGVLPADFLFDDVEIFTPFIPPSDPRERNNFAYRALAALHTGVSRSQAETEVQAILPGREGWTLHLATPQEKTSNDCGPTCAQQHNGIWLLFGAASLILLLACANVANLLLARSMTRRREFLIRAAIGCNRGRLIRQILTETLLLFFCGGAVGLLFASWFAAALARFADAYVAVRSAGAILLDPRALTFTAVATLLAALLFGLIPSIQSTGTPSIVPRRKAFRALLVGSEFTLSLVLLVGFGLLLRSFLQVESIPVGVRVDRLLTISGNPAINYKDSAPRLALARRLLDKLRTLPAVSSAALTTHLPLTGADDTRIRFEASVASPTEVRYVAVSPNFFRTLEIPLLAGRSFSEHDSARSGYVVVINETMAHLLFPHENPLGHRIQTDDAPPIWREIVGIAADVRQRNLEEDSRPVFYLPYSQGTLDNFSFAIRVRSAADMPLAAQAVHKAAREADPQIAWEPVKSMRQIIYDSESISLRRP